MASDLAVLIGERLGIDFEADPRPYLAATVWIAAFGWFRHRIVSTHQRMKKRNTAGAVNDIVKFVQATGPFLMSPPPSTGARKKKS